MAEDADPQAALAQLEGLDLEEPQLSVVLDEPVPNGPDVPRPYHLKIDATLGEVFGRYARSWVGTAADSAAVPYTAGRKPDPNELVWIKLGDAPVAGSLAPQLGNPGAHPTFRLADAPMSRTRLYSVSLQAADGRWVHLTRKLTRGFRLAKANGVMATLFEGDRYTGLPDDSLHFDTDFDVMIWQGYLYIARQADFERTYDFGDVAGTEVEKTLKVALKEVPVVNKGEFLAIAHSDQRMHTKVRSIAERLQDPTYRKKVTAANLKRLADARDDVHLRFKGSGDKLKVVFEDTPATRWTLLKVLDDDYLLSELTDIRYEANSKVRSG